MIPGLGVLRRIVTLALCGAAFWAGQRSAEFAQADRCLDAGGRISERGFCEGAAP